MPLIPQLSSFSIKKLPPQVDTIEASTCPFLVCLGPSWGLLSMAGNSREMATSAVAAIPQGSQANAQGVTDGAYDGAGAGQLTPVSMSSGSRSLSPKTPDAPQGRSGEARRDDLFAPKIAGEYGTSPQGSGRLGGYGGFSAEPESFESTPSSPRKYGGNFKQRTDMSASGPSDSSTFRRPAVATRNAFPARSMTTGSSSSSIGEVLPGSLPRQNETSEGGFRPEGEDFKLPPFGAANRSETFPRPGRVGGGAGMNSDAPMRTPSAPGPGPGPGAGPRSLRARRPSNADTRRPERGGYGEDSVAALAREFGQANPFHSPSASASSSTSISSSHSTRPTPPSSQVSPGKLSASKAAKAAPTGSRFDDLLSDLQKSVDEVDQVKELPRVPPQPTPAPKDDDSVGRYRNETDRLDGPRRTPLGLSASPNSTERARRYDPAVQSSRGSCKACRQSIIGKSISSADGRLTGRYHKACFVCTQCRAPFSSSTFYVMNDAPYCELHYHELNGSLCSSCGVGIEGQYLEDEAARKHHPTCFRCGDCGKVLQDGYFEVNGQAYCETDAWARVQQHQQQSRAQSPLAGGRSPPEGPSSRLAPPQNPGSRLGPGSGPGPGQGQRLGGRATGLPGNVRLASRPRLEKRMTRLGMM
jgi:hypothetical protein